jgi:DNA-binding NarL/FixJ family response regulator
MNEPSRLLVVDDDPMVRDAYRGFFSHQTEFVLCGEARDGAEGVEAYAKLRPDVVLMDLQMPGVSGIDATRQICDRWSDACVVAMTTFGTAEYVVAALRAGASGYLLKDVGGVALLDGLRQALAGEMPLSSSVRRELVTSVVANRTAAPAPVADVGLTKRERELVGWLAQGLTNSQIGAQMYVSEGSVKQYLSHIGVKLGVKSRTGILIRAVQLNVVDPQALPPVQG